MNMMDVGVESALGVGVYALPLEKKLFFFTFTAIK